MKKNTFTILLVLLISFFFCCQVSAKEKLVCKYQGTSTNEWDIDWTWTFELELTLTDNETQVNKIYQTLKGDSECKNKVQNYVDGWSKEELDKYCNQKITYNEDDVNFDMIILEGDSCPQTIGVDVSSNPRRFYKGTSYKLQSSNKVYLGKVSCGNVEKIPTIVPELTSMAITIVQIVVPIILVLMGSLDLFKGITAGKEDEMKKGQQMFIKRLIVGAVIFFVVVIVKFLVSVVADTNVNNIVDCIDCFVSNDC